MTEKPGVRWLNEKYGVDIDSLDTDLVLLANKLGPCGIDAMLEDAKQKPLFRGRSLSKRELVVLLESITRLDSNIEWEFKWDKIDDKPSDWINQELDVIWQMIEDRI